MSYRLFAYHYDQLMADTPYTHWLDFVRQCWLKYGKPESVVDLGCGTGNISLALFSAGFDVTAIDLSDDMLAVGQQKYMDSLRVNSPLSGGSLKWLHQDMREWALPQKVDCVISMCDCFNYLLEEEDVVQAFHQTFEGLKPGGMFIFDVLTPLQFQIYGQEQPFMLNEEDIAYIWTCELDKSNMEIEHSITIFAKEGLSGSFRRIEEIHRQRAYPVEKLIGWLDQAGFKQVHCMADFGFQVPDSPAGRIFFTAIK